MSESSLPSNSSQSRQTLPHSANADAIERQLLYEREATLQHLLSAPSLGSDSLAAAIQGMSISVGDFTDEPSPHPDDLVVLIQALNQCNSNLLARVGDLETALAASQAELKAQQAQTLTTAAPQTTQADLAEEASLRAELNTVKQKVMKLRQQMNAAYHANQTHRARIQELEQALAEMAEKYTNLTNTHTQLQEQFQSQSQRLVEAENTCRDLCLRLHRQQQYTLQFKTALKARAAASATDAIETAIASEIRPWSMASSADEANAQADETAATLPSGELESSAANTARDVPSPAAPSPFMDIAILPNPEAAGTGEVDLAPIHPDSTDAEHSAITEQSTGSRIISLDLPDFPAVQHLDTVADGAADKKERQTDADSDADSLEATSPQAVVEPSSQPLSPISFDMKQCLPKWAKFSHVSLPSDADVSLQTGMLPEGTHPASIADVQSILDRCIGDPWEAPSSEDAAIAPKSTPAQPVPNTQLAPNNSVQEAPTPEITLDPALLEQLDAAVRPLLDSVVDAIRSGEPSAPPEPDLSRAIAPEQPVAQVSETPSTPPMPLKLDLNRAEEDLWRDLAKLVDISTDDIIQASLSGDFDAFTAIDFDALRASASERVTAASSEAGGSSPEPPSTDAATASDPCASDQSLDNTAHPEAALPIRSSIQDGLDLPFSQPSADPIEQSFTEPSPSPIVYPDRAPRKIKSIAAVDLPTFPRVQPT